MVLLAGAVSRGSRRSVCVPMWGKHIETPVTDNKPVREKEWCKKYTFFKKNVLFLLPFWNFLLLPIICLSLFLLYILKPTCYLKVTSIASSVMLLGSSGTGTALFKTSGSASIKSATGFVYAVSHTSWAWTTNLALFLCETHFNI